MTIDNRALIQYWRTGRKYRKATGDPVTAGNEGSLAYGLDNNLYMLNSDAAKLTAGGTGAVNSDNDPTLPANDFDWISAGSLGLVAHGTSAERIASTAAILFYQDNGDVYYRLSPSSNVWIKGAGSGSSSLGITTYTHTVTAGEATANAFTLTSAPVTSLILQIAGSGPIWAPKHFTFTGTAVTITDALTQTVFADGVEVGVTIL